RLPGERDLAERFDVSRVTIREAEIALQALGYIRIKTGSGVYVLDPSDKKGNGMPSVSAFELTEARLLFESEAAALAAQNIGDSDLQVLDDLIERMSSTDPADEEDSQQADREFHLAIAAASGNAAVQYIVETLWKMRSEISAIREVHAAICSTENAEDRGSEHADVLDALRNRDPVAARNAMHSHFRRLLGSMIDVTEEQALQELRQKVTASRQRFLKTGESG
ncbi:MAG: FadR family transcriptional regulator, partial [Gammaproteobacteria bacterium]|nr:FadR family transcriptional regulator [Gammaproteobacteria bacterium]